MYVCYNVRVKLYIRGTIMCELENVIENNDIDELKKYRDRLNNILKKAS